MGSIIAQQCWADTEKKPEQMQSWLEVTLEEGRAQDEEEIGRM